MSLDVTETIQEGECPLNEWLLNGTQLSRNTHVSQSMVDDANEWLLNGTHPNLADDAATPHTVVSICRPFSPKNELQTLQVLLLHLLFYNTSC